MKIKNKNKNTTSFFACVNNYNKKLRVSLLKQIYHLMISHIIMHRCSDGQDTVSLAGLASDKNQRFYFSAGCTPTQHGIRIIQTSFSQSPYVSIHFSSSKMLNEHH